MDSPHTRVAFYVCMLLIQFTVHRIHVSQKHIILLDEQRDVERSALCNIQVLRPMFEVVETQNPSVETNFEDVETHFETLLGGVETRIKVL